jgi:peroxiredoxin Q/BCP
VSTSQPPGGTVDVIREGDPAPDFTLEADDGSMVSLASLEGRNVVLFFYPKDNTSG